MPRMVSRGAASKGSPVFKALGALQDVVPGPPIERRPSRRAVVVLSGEPPPEAWVRAELPAFLVAADGGAQHAASWRLRPDLIVGDMDSVDPDLLARFEAEGTRVVRYPREKLETDGGLAVDAALDWGADVVVLVGSAGGRLDFAMTNAALLLRVLARGRAVRAIEKTGRMWGVVGSDPIEVAVPRGTVVSFVPLNDRVEGLRIQGVRWPLPRSSDPAAGATVTRDAPYTVSNEALGGIVRVSVSSGAGALILPEVPTSGPPAPPR